MSSHIQTYRDRGFDKTVRVGVKRYYIQCSQCEALVINGIPTHERGCPNSTPPIPREIDHDEC